MPTSRSYHEYLIESLKDSEEAAAYLDAVLEDGNLDELRLALNNVAEAHRSALENTQLALSTDALDPNSSKQSHLDLYLLLKVLDELGFRLSIKLKENAV
jgi:DNA-binding phage protein